MSTTFDWSAAIGGSPIFIALIGCSVVMLAVALERGLYYWRRRDNPDATLREALERVRSGDYDKADWTVRQCRHPLGTAAANVFANPRATQGEVEEKLHVALSGEKLLLERNLAVLGTLATIAPLIGLLGTVWGIMRAFHDMALTGSAAPSVVAAGVAEALVTTAAGLVVAVPALLLYNHFARRMNVMLTVAENHTRAIRNAVLENGNQAAVSQPEPVRRAA
jgi:biopolymer transport protein ExbB